MLEGSVRTAGKHLRVTVQLNDAGSGFQIWSKRCDRDLEDVFEVQDAIASDVVAALKLRFGAEQELPRAKRYTEDVEAYQDDLPGRYHWLARTKGGFQRATQYFEQAIQKDPNYAQAYCGLADLHSVLGSTGRCAPAPLSPGPGSLRASGSRVSGPEPLPRAPRPRAVRRPALGPALRAVRAPHGPRVPKTSCGRSRTARILGRRVVRLYSTPTP